VLEPWLPELGRFLRAEIAWPEAGGGTHEAAARGEPADTPPSHLTWNLLAAADAWGMGARGVPESLELAVLFGPWILSAWRSGDRRGHDFWTHAEELMRPTALRMNIPRRASYEMREILGLQDRLVSPPDTKRRLRSVVERSAFPEALAWYQLELRARGADLEPIARWRAIADEVWAHERRHSEGPVPHAPTDFEPGAEDGPVRDLEEEPLVGEPEPVGRRRGRRGGRGRRPEPRGDDPRVAAGPSPMADVFRPDAPAPAPAPLRAAPPAPVRAVPPSPPRLAPAPSASVPHEPVAPRPAPPAPIPPPQVRAEPPPAPPARTAPPPSPAERPFGTGLL
jgi:hypothetical protein